MKDEDARKDESERRRKNPFRNGLDSSFILHPSSLNNVLLNLLSSLNIASKEWVIRQYDHEVQGGSVIKPLVGAASHVGDQDVPVQVRVAHPRRAVRELGGDEPLGDHPLGSEVLRITDALTVGYGMTYQGEYTFARTSPTADLYYTDAYLSHRAMASYEWNDNVALQLNIDNVTDEEYYERIRNNAANGWATPGAGRSAVLSVCAIAPERVMMSANVKRPSRLWRMRCNSPFSALALSAFRKET